MANHFDAKKLVLGGLLNEADTLSKKVISSYNPSALYKVNLEKMKAHGATYLEACAQFLGFVVRDNDKKLYQNQTILCDRMILKIESLFDIICDECDTTYRNEVSDEPLIVCRLCMQGCHNCDGMKEKTNAMKDLIDKNLLPPGGAWLCHACLEKNDLSLLPQKSQKAPTSSADPSAPTLEVIEEETTVEKEGERESPRRGRSDPSSQQPQTDENCDHMENICRDYVARKCPHGLTGKRVIDGKKCQFNHPPRCRRYCGFGEDKKLGCRRGKECKYYHPRLCRQSEISRSCMNRDCSFVHLKRTKRLPKLSNKPVMPTNLQNAPKQHEQPNKDPWPPLSQFSRVNSMASLSTPYPPTIENPAAKNRKIRNNSQSEKDYSFLEKLLENLKDGILSQMDSKIADLRDQMPSMIQESVLWNQQAPRSRHPSGTLPFPVPVQPPFQTQMTLAPQAAYTIPSYPGSCY